MKPIGARRVEGVLWFRWIVRYALADGTRRRMVRWSPWFPWIRGEVGRELAERFGIDKIKPGSVTIREGF